MKTSLSLLFAIILTFSVSAQDYAVQQLENSPRHYEWVEIETSGRTMHNFVAYPERSDKAPVFIVIHENRGLNDWARSFTDQLASKGFIAIAPDLISNTVDGIEKTNDFENSDAARSAIYALDAENVTQDLNAVLEYAKKIEAGNGKVFIIGFCWGGSQSFRFATNAGDDIEAALVFYGTGPQDAEAYSSIEVPVYGIYEGAGHAYMRRGDDPEASNDDPNVKARNASWDRLIKIVKDH